MTSTDQGWVDTAAWAAWAAMIAGLIALGLGAPGCCVGTSHGAAETQAATTAAANWGHAREGDPVGFANAVAWDAQFFALSGEWRTPEARERVLEALGVESEEELLERLEAAE